MKFLKNIFYIISLTFPQLLFSQDIEVILNQTTRYAPVGTSEIILDFKIVNISPVQQTVFEVRTINNLPPGWTSSLCFSTLCYAPYIDSIATTPDFGFNPLEPGDTLDTSVHFFTDLISITTGYIQLDVGTFQHPQDRITIDFIGTTDPTVLMSIVVVAPNGGELWEKNTIKQIQWTSGGVNNVKLEYTSDGDTTWNVIVSSISANIGFYYWMTPNIQSEFCRIRISDVEDSTLYDVSDNYFTIGRPRTEIEPNDNPAQANLIEIGDSLDASINPVGDVDYFKFYASVDDTLIISAYDINLSDLYGRVEIIDENGSLWNVFNFYTGNSYQVIFNPPFLGNYFLRVSYAYSAEKNSFRSIRDSVEFHRKKQLNTVMAETGEYRISVQSFIPTIPQINFVYTFDTYFNSTKVGVEFNPMGLDTHLKIEYGLTPSYGNLVEIPGTFNSINFVWVVARLTELEAGSYYYLKVTAENDSGIVSEETGLVTPERPEFWTVKSIDSIYYFWLNDVSFANDKIGYITNGSENSILKTTDGGDTWITMYPGFYTFKIFCIDSLNVLALYDFGILTTTNGGSSWTSRSIPNSSSLSDLFFLDVSNGYVVGFGGSIYKTTNGGISWMTQNSGTSNGLLSLYFHDKNNGWACGENGTIIKTTDGGTNWSSVNISTSSWLNKICFTDSVNGYVLAGWEGYIYKTSDSGFTWTSQYSGLNDLRDISFLDKNNGIIIGGYQGDILLTTNAGVTWSPQLSGTFNYLSAVSKTTNNWVAVGDFGTILKSTYDIVSVENIFNVPTVFSLNQNYPNPFNPSTKINWQSPVDSWQTIKIYDVIGNDVETLVDEYKTAGIYEVEWDASGFPSGVYFYQLKAGDFIDTKKMILIK